VWFVHLLRACDNIVCVWNMFECWRGSALFLGLQVLNSGRNLSFSPRRAHLA